LNSATFRKMSDKTFTHQSNVPSVEARGVGLSFPVYPHTQRRIRGNLEFVRDCPFGCCLCLLVLAIASLGGRSRVLALLMFALLPLSFRLNSCVGAARSWRLRSKRSEKTMLSEFRVGSSPSTRGVPLANARFHISQHWRSSTPLIPT
jgi:hypothetical protein